MKSSDFSPIQNNINYSWAYHLIHYFSLLGIKQAVVSPGSRSTPLALACEQHPQISTWIQIDERSAGFFALGLAQQEQQAVLLICTSGSALTNWFPAVVEANHSYTPLILLSADRPLELHHCGANQTIEQSHLFGSHVRSFIALEHAHQDLLDTDYLRTTCITAYNASIDPVPGPVHINIPIREPLLPIMNNDSQLNDYIQATGQQIRLNHRHNELCQPSPKYLHLSLNEQQLLLLSNTIRQGKGIVVCGRLTAQEQQDFAPLLIQLARHINCPVLLDPLSNLRFSGLSSSHFISNYDHFLKATQHSKQIEELCPLWIIRFGQFPLSKNLHNYLQSLNSDTFLINAYQQCLDPIHKVNTFLAIAGQLFCQTILAMNFTHANENENEHFLKKWQLLEQQSQLAITCSVEQCQHLFEAHVVRGIIKHIADKALLFSGNSMAIRDIDTFTHSTHTTNKQIHILANRGTSGIDGNVSTFLGLLSQHKGYGVALLGDLTFFHDMNGLLLCSELAAQGCNATIIVINNNGGGIFNYLPQKQLDEFDKLWKTEINLDFQHTARLYQLNYFRIDHLAALDKTLITAFNAPGIQLVEIIIEQKISVECHKKI